MGLDLVAVDADGMQVASAYHGSYTKFNVIRVAIERFVFGHELVDDDICALISFPTEYSTSIPFTHREFVALYIFLLHYDCDGLIYTEDCKPLADALKRILAHADPSDLNEPDVDVVVYINKMIDVLEYCYKNNCTLRFM